MPGAVGSSLQQPCHGQGHHPTVGLPFLVLNFFLYPLPSCSLSLSGNGVDEDSCVGLSSQPLILCPLPAAHCGEKLLWARVNVDIGKVRGIVGIMGGWIDG